MRKRKNDYLVEVTDEYEGMWCRSDAKALGYRYYHLILALHGDYGTVDEALTALKPLEAVLGEIRHYNTPADEEKGLMAYEGRHGHHRGSYEGYGVINSRLHRRARGWTVDLWLLEELTDWSILEVSNNI